MATPKRFVFVSCVVCFLLPSVFSLKDVIYNLTEEEPPNTYLGNVATDADLFSEISNPDDQNMKYSFLTNSFVQYFNINERQSSLYTAKRIDREDICEFSVDCVLSLEVIARSSSGQIYKKIQVKINLLDDNDHTPTFTVKSITREISEGSLIGYTIPIDSAEDKDRGIYAIQTYSLEPEDSPFSVDFSEREDGSTRVQLVLNEKLNREAQNQYHIRVTAADGDTPPKTGTLEVDLSVTDINDNAPSFSKKVYNVTVTEDVAPNTTIETVYASDPDQGINGLVSYKFSQNQDPKINSLFAIDEVTGEIYVVGSLIYEPGESYKIYVVASDSADPPLRSQAQVFVKVLDVHNNPPQINVNLLSNTDVGEIPENASINAAVAHIIVFDPDTGLNGIVECSTDSNKFTLQRFDVREYKVVLSQPLNRESVDRYDVTVLCHDTGSPQLNSSATFRVHVMDVNDNRPRFTQTTYVVNVKENSSLGSSVYRVTASDFDSGKNSEIVYTLQNSGDHKFNIDPIHGLITVAGSLDRETRSQYKFVVFARDRGTPSLTGSAEVRIFITDVNDNSPVFIETAFEYNLVEGNSVNLSVGALKAQDKDEGKNGAIKYSLHPNYRLGIPFIVLENGTILASQVIDREVKDRYDFTVVAEDGGSPSLRNSAHVTIFVLDINDNAPQFVFPNHKNNTLIISYQTKPNTIIGTIEGRDLDAGLNAKVTYFMKDKNFSNIFQLNSLSGRLVLIKELSVNDAGKYSFGIIAQDKGTPPRTNDILLSVVVTTQAIGGGETGTEENRHYFLIAVAISCVTVVIAIVIILTICLIKRADRIKQRYHHGNKDGDQGESRMDTRKKVSFSVDERDMSSMPNRTNESHLYPSLTIPASIQVSLKGSPEKSESDSGQGSLDSAERRHHQIRSLQLHQALLHGCNDVARRPASQMSPTGILRRQQEADNHSDLSGEATTSDSGRGGSEDDLNNSCVLSSFSGDFDNFKHNPRGKLHSISKANPRIHDKHEDLFPLPESDFVQKDFGKPLCLPTISLSDRFFNFESTQDGLSTIKNGGMSPTGSSYMFGGNDDSTTTSGSYVLEDEDEYVEVLQPSRQCIV